MPKTTSPRVLCRSFSPLLIGQLDSAYEETEERAEGAVLPVNMSMTRDWS